MGNQIQELFSLAIMGGIALAILLNYKGAAAVIKASTEGAVRIIRTVSGTDPSQRG